MTAVLTLVLAASILVGVAPSSFAAPPPRPPGSKCLLDCPKPDVRGNDGGLDVVVTGGSSQAVPGRGDGADGEAPGRTEWVTREEHIAPACSANGLDGPDVLCTNAVSSCPTPDQVRYWVWHRVTQHRLGPPRTSEVGEWEQEPGSYCLGADDPGVPDIARALAQVQTAFDNLPLPKFATQINPAPRTLVNIPTRLSAGSAETATFTPVLLGIRITITARPTSWAWTFGDGETAETSVPLTEHVYRTTQRVGARVRVTWTGTFTVGSAPEVFPIRAPAFVQGPVSEVEVVQARVQLVAD